MGDVDMFIYLGKCEHIPLTPAIEKTPSVFVGREIGTGCDTDSRQKGD